MAGPADPLVGKTYELNAGLFKPNRDIVEGA